MVTTKELKKGDKDWGFTLTEVLVALTVIGIILAFCLRLFTDQWRVTQEVKNRMEAHFAVLNAGRTILDDIRSAQVVDWDNMGTLRILPWGEGASQDAYFIDDRDYDGIKDLYIKHEGGVPNPVASRIISWNCMKGEAGLWIVTFQAQVGQQTVNWKGISRQRTYLPAQP